METLKQALAFPVYATAAWLIWVLAQQVDARGLFAALIGVVLVGFAAWAWERSRNATPLGERIFQGLAGLAVIAVVTLGFGLSQQPALSTAQAASEGTEPFSRTRLDTLRDARRPVFVNLTAAWCITCAVNETTSLSRPSVAGGDAGQGRHLPEG